MNEKNVLAIFGSPQMCIRDSIYFAYTTWQDKQKIENPLLNEIKMFHTNEFHAALHSIAIINQALHTDFDEHEAAFLAFHYINALSLIHI